MKKLAQIAIGLTIALTTATAFADTLFLKSGERISGFFEGGSARVLKFRSSDGVVRDFDIFAVERLQFGDETKPAAAVISPLSTPVPAPLPPVAAPVRPPVAAPATAATTSGPRLLAGAE
jgi:hypothetical protein